MNNGCHKEIGQTILNNSSGLVYVYAQEGVVGTHDLIVQHTISLGTEAKLEEIIEFVSTLGYQVFHRKEETTFDESTVKDEGLIRLYNSSQREKAGETTVRLYKNPNSFCFVTFYSYAKQKGEESGAKTVNIHIAGSSEDIERDINQIIEFSEKIRKVKKPVGEIYTIASSNSGFYFSKMGSEGEEYFSTNYSSEHAEARDYILQQLNEEKPNGRLSIFFGPPGTGKTHFIKSLLGHVDSSIFVYVPPHLIPDISNPSFVTAIIEHRDSYPNQKIIFVLEDADQVLATRMSDNMSDINGLLNLTDGFLASSFDIRIIATTNSKAADIDPAIMRPGRLCAKLNFAPLNREDADICYRNLTNGKELSEISDKKELTLAEVYSFAAHANAPAILSDSKKSKSFGF